MYHSGTSQIVNHSSYHYNMWSVVSKELNINYRDRPNFGYGYGFGAETGSNVSFGPVSVSANQGSAKLRLRPKPPQSFGRLPKLHNVGHVPATLCRGVTARRVACQ